MHNQQKENISSILQALAYFDVFNFPLSKKELFNYSKFKEEAAFQEELNALQGAQLIHNLNEYYSIQTDETLVRSRLEGEKRADQYHSQALKKSKLISKFPYVRGVYISGSLSKGVMSEDGDIDFFIITKPNRLWIARTFLIFYKKTILLNSRKYFCVNYFIDEEHLEIEQKNRFTATEIVTLLPMVNKSLYKAFMRSNQWIEKYYSNTNVSTENTIELRRSLFQKMVEPLLNTSLGERMDTYFMNLTLKRWNKKFGEMESSDFDVAMKTSKRISKHHPSNFQASVLERFHQRLEKINDHKVAE